MRTLVLNIAAAIVDMLVVISTHAAEKALDAQDALAPNGQMTPAQKEVQTARDNLLETVARLATAQEHLNSEHAEQQAALSMHSSQAAQAYQQILGIQGFSDAISNTQKMVDAILNPPTDNPTATPPELVGTTELPAAPVAVTEGLPVPTTAQ